jgi:two-component system response regulator DesR
MQKVITRTSSGEQCLGQQAEQANKVLLVSDNQMICAGIRRLLETQPNMVFIGKVATARRTLEVAAREQPQVTLIDLDLFGMDVVRLIRDLQKAAEQSRPLILSSLRKGNLTRLVSCWEGIGIVLTLQPPAVLIATIESLCSGNLQNAAPAGLVHAS